MLYSLCECGIVEMLFFKLMFFSLMKMSVQLICFTGANYSVYRPIYK